MVTKSIITKPKFSIRITVVSVFILGTLITALIALCLQYHFSEKMVLESSVKNFSLTNKSVENRLAELDSLSQKVLHILANSSALIESKRTDSIELRSVISELLQLNPLFLSMYISEDNGNFYDLINLNSHSKARKSLKAKDVDHWVLVNVTNERDKKIQYTHYFDELFKLRLSISKETNHDHRERVWYKNAYKDTVYKTEPYFFHYLQAPGVTYSMRSQTNSVIALDVSLEGVSNFLLEQKDKTISSTKTKIFLYNRNGEVIASNTRKDVQFSNPLKKISLTKEQKKYLQEKSDIKISNETDWPPMDFSVSGQPRGYSIDLINAISTLLDVDINYINGFSWFEFIEQFNNNKIDIIQPVFNSIKNKKMGLLSESIATLPLSIATHSKSNKTIDYKQLNGKKIAIGKGWAIKKLIEDNISNVKIVEVNSSKEVLDMVSRNEVYAGIDIEPVLRYTQKQFYIKNIVYSPLPQPLFTKSLHFLFHFEDEHLKELFNHAIKELPNDFMRNLQKKWFDPKDKNLSINMSVVPYPELIERLSSNTNIGSLELVKIDGIEQYLYINSVDKTGNNEFLAILVPKKILLNPIREEIKISIIITSLCLLIIFPISWWLASPIVNPIRKLEHETKKIKSQDYTSLLIMDSNITEISNLALSMASMSESIQQHEKSQKVLIDSFIELIAQAIDDKSPYTAGHCKRVPELGIMLANAASESRSASFKDFKFKNEDEIREFSLAAWLHDCGKITTPEHIVDKATKLETIYNRIHEIRMRFEVLLRDAELRYYQKVEATPSEKVKFKEELDLRKLKLYDDFEFIASCNIGKEYMDDENILRLTELSKVTWQRYFDDRLGLSSIEESRLSNVPQPTLPTKETLLIDKEKDLIPHDQPIKNIKELGIKIEPKKYKYNLGELYNLKVQRGTLTPEDRYKINEHIVSTIKMLEGIPFPKNLSRVPRYASTHHETLIGNGYPRQLTGKDLSIPERILVLADIFEALTADDRPYKKAKPLSVSIRILANMVNKSHIDRDVFELFLKSGIYLKYAHKFLKPEQIDTVNIDEFIDC